MSMKNILIAFLCCSTLYACNEKDDDTGCWQAVELNGSKVNGLIVCNVTQAQAQTQHPQYWFYNTNEAVFCWRITNANSAAMYYSNMPESIITKLTANSGAAAVKIDCNSYCIWQILEKHKSKITGQFNPNRQLNETFTTDTCTKLFAGKVVTYRETVDSLITREFTKKIN